MTMPIFAVLALLVPAQTPDQPGPHEVSSATGYTLAIPSGDIQGDLYWPMDASEPAPIVVIGHGFQRSSHALAGWGSHLASHGMIVVLPNFPGGFRPDHAGNGRRMSEIIQLVRASPGPITARPDPSRSAVMGHSAGGLAAIFAAANDPTISLFVGLDPVDARGGEGLSAIPQIVQPSLVLAGAPSPCNSNASAATLWTGVLARESWFLRVNEAAHFDAEDPSDHSIIVRGCGGSNEMHRTLFRRYATAHLLAHFRCQGLDYLPDGRGTQDDLASGVVRELHEVSPMGACGAAPDAGVPPIEVSDASVEIADAGADEDAAELADAGIPDAGRVIPPQGAGKDASMPPEHHADAGAAGGAQPSGEDAGAAAAQQGGGFEKPSTGDDGCGCRTTGGREATAAFGSVIMLIGLMGLRSRRR